MIVAPRSLAFRTQRKPTGCASAMDEPSIKMQSALARSCCAVVAPPRPKEVPRPGTVLLCHIRAWLETQTIPRPRVNSFRSEEHTSELQSHSDLVCRLLLEKKNK